MEHKIGTKITLEVVESDNSCKGCFFDKLYNCKRIQCKLHEREDNKSIIYKEIKEE